MRRIGQIFFFFLFIGQTNGQSKIGITGIRDTSYNILNEYNKLLKNYPSIQVAKELPYNYVHVEQDLSFCQTPERELKLDIYYRDSDRKSKQPALLFIFGGGWRSGNKTMNAPLLKEMAALGYVCFAPDYRLSTEALYPAAIHDIKSAIRWVRKNARKYNIDPDKIIAAGHSAGGELAAFMGATNNKKEFEGNGCEQQVSSKVNAVIDLDGTLAFLHPESGEGDDSKKISAATYWFGYSKTENPEIWKQAAPLTHVGKQMPPVQFINSAVARMHAGREDFIKILNHHNIYSEVKTLEGAPHSFLLFHPWFDSTVAYMDNFLRKIFSKTKGLTKDIVVSKDGSGDFRSVQEAINSIPTNTKTKWAYNILIKNGVYEEKITVDSLHIHISLQGEDKLNTILSYNDHTGKISPSGDTINTRTSSSFKILAHSFTARDITFRNNAGFNAGQAVAVESNGDLARFFNCRFIGFQDVLFTNKDYVRQYFENCYIEGTTDFIFGSSSAWFEKCQIHSKKNSHVTAASTPKNASFGYVFNNCMLTGDTSLHNVSLGRPWRPYANVVYLNTYMGSHIKPEGFSVWNNNDNHLTAIFAEYQSYGPGGGKQARLKWTKQLTENERKIITIEKVLVGWNPVYVIK